MIDREALLTDLKKQVKGAEKDLHAQVRTLVEVRLTLDEEYKRARELGRTAATWSSWLDERLTQVAAAWVLGTVFVRFCEDNRLIPEPYLTGPDDDRRDLALARYEEYVERDPDPTFRGWLLHAFDEIGSGPAGRSLFDQAHNPLYQVPLSHDGARGLVTFWRERDEQGALVHDFTDPLNEEGTEGWNTRFLGDLYQDLSEKARKTYALLQTPDFVEEFILDRTMTPALREFGHQELRMIDPTCGSGHFVLGAFHRLVSIWREKQPSGDRHTQVAAALNSVHGVDINPFAIAIARFRLLVAAMAVAGVRTLAEANQWEWPLHLAVGDSLIKAQQTELTLGGEEQNGPTAHFTYATEDLHEHGILTPGRYHVVVGNPPYITVKDSALSKLYRKLYTTCDGSYALSVPFAERFFELAVRGNGDSRGYGMVGQITANSFMKREFGKRLIEDFFRDRVELREVIDTSGAYIPGHGTPTVILVGTRRDLGRRTLTVRTVRSIQGEPAAPERPQDGLVWRAIVEHLDRPGTNTPWVATDDLDRRKHLGQHPWILTAGGLELVDELTSTNSSRLGSLADQIGAGAVTREDSAYLIGSGALRRHRIPTRHRRPLVEGEEVRDYGFKDPTESLWPYAEETLEPEASEGCERLLWPLRIYLCQRVAFGKTQLQRKLAWFEYSMFFKRRYSCKQSIAFPFVSTHNHFTLNRKAQVFIRTAPIIKLPEGATEEEHLRLLGVLNSSTACFWLKMVSHSKGNGGVGGGISDELWEHRFEFTGTKVEDFPLPQTFPLHLTTALDTAAQLLSASTPGTASTPSPTVLRESRTTWHATRSQMIALQEELDWQVYSLYGLHEDLRVSEDPESPDIPQLHLGERAFEIVLARKVAAGEASDEWFKRHGSTPITEIPGHWPEAYQRVVARRIEAIETSRAIGLIERPEYKRRWATEGWDALQAKALRSWLLDRMEKPELWYDANDQPALVSLRQLTHELERDEEFVSVAGLYAPQRELATVIAELITEEHVPFLAALRYKPSGLQKRADWEHVWDEQRREDATEDETQQRKVRDAIPVPPKYAQADFLRASFWRARGKLDVPKERFLSYGQTNVATPELYGWAGWDHNEQAFALDTYLALNEELSTAEVTPFLAGLLELQPWLDQWHHEFDPDYGISPAELFRGDRQSLQDRHGLTDEDLRNWRPETAKRGRKSRK